MAGKRQKHPSTLVFQRAGRARALEVVSPDRTRVPPTCPPGASPEAKAAWECFWSSNVSSVVSETDHPALLRWLWWFDQWRRTAKKIEAGGPLTRGARGDWVLRNTVRYLRICEAALQSLEEAFGMTPLARMRLGITFSEEPSAGAKLRQPAKPEPFGHERDGPALKFTGHQ